MFLPIGDSPNPGRLPWLTILLIAANVVVYVLLLPASFRPADPRDPDLRLFRQVVAAERGVVLENVSAGELVRFEHGTKPVALDWRDILSSMFLHGGFAHLFGNMLFLWIFGDNVEDRLGRFFYLLFYLATGYAAAFGDALLRAGSAIPSVGASGAISGVLGFYLVCFPRNRVRVFLFLFPLVVDVIEVSALFMLGFYIVIDNLLPLFLAGGEGGISYGAHLGGFIAGLAIGLFFRRPANPNETQDEHRRRYPSWH